MRVRLLEANFDPGYQTTRPNLIYAFAAPFAGLATVFEFEM